MIALTPGATELHNSIKENKNVVETINATLKGATRDLALYCLTGYVGKALITAHAVNVGTKVIGVANKEIQGEVSTNLKIAESLEVDAYSTSSQYWNKKTTFSYDGQSNVIYQRNDLFDLLLKDGKGRTNIQLMQKGRAPIGIDKEPINLHHMLQTKNGAIAEVTETFHTQYTKIIHINPSSIPSGIDRSMFKK